MYSPRKRSLEVFNAASAPIRLKILRLLYSIGPLNYSEIMNQLELSPNRDAGKFAYHLKSTVNAGLVNLVKETKKYKITPIGRAVVDFDQRIDEHLQRAQGKLLVRTSRIAIEEFDKNMISQVLNREAGVPIDLAQKIAGETEERLQKLDTLYLTASLIREFVNAILIEKGLQEYRHKLTRLGIPVYDVTRIIKSAIGPSQNVETLHSLTGDNVFREYTLLNVLPRDVADAHLSGSLHVSGLEHRILKLNEFQHDLRLFLQNGFRSDQMGISLNPPKNLCTALLIVSAIIENSQTGLAGEQCINHFNLFLAPFVQKESSEKLNEILTLFLFNINKAVVSGSPIKISLGLDFTVPRHLAEEEAIGIDGRPTGCYGDYTDDAQKLLNKLVDINLSETHKPIFNPKLIFNINTNILRKKEIRSSIQKVHKLVARYGTPYFINLTKKWQNKASYISTGTRLASDWTNDWELDTIRSGAMDNIIINLPRLAYESRGSDTKLRESLNNCLEIIGKSLDIERHEIKDRVNFSLLPILSQKIRGEQYLRLRNSTSLIGFIGLNEATKIQTDHQLGYDNEAFRFAFKLIKYMANRVEKLSKELDFRINLTQTSNLEVSQRLAELDAKKFGWGVVFTQGTKENPYYTDLVAVPLETEISIKERLKVEGAFHKFSKGGHISLIELVETEQKLSSLLETTEIICKNDVGAFAFSRAYSFCDNCRRSFVGIMLKCPSCKAVDSLTQYGRLVPSYLPLNDWPKPKKMAVNKRFRYII